MAQYEVLNDNALPIKTQKSGGKKVRAGLFVILLIGLGLAGWYVLPRFLSGGGGGAVTTMSYMPPDSDEIWGINVGPLEGHAARKSLRLVFHELDLDFGDLDAVMDGSSLHCSVLVEQHKNPVDVDRVRRKLYLSSAETIEGQAVCRDHRAAKGVHDPSNMVFSPSSKTCVLGSVSEVDLKQMLSRTWPANSRDMQAQVKKVQGSGLWSVVSLDAQVRPGIGEELAVPDKFAARDRSNKVEMCVWLTRIKLADTPNLAPGEAADNAFIKVMAEMRTRFADVKTVAFTAQPADAKALKLEARIDFASEGDAKAVEKILVSKDALKKFTLRLAQRAGGSLVARLVETYGSYAAKEAETSLAVKTEGSSLIISATLTETTFNGMTARLEMFEREETERKNFEP